MVVLRVWATCVRRGVRTSRLLLLLCSLSLCLLLLLMPPCLLLCWGSLLMEVLLLLVEPHRRMLPNALLDEHRGTPTAALGLSHSPPAQRPGPVFSDRASRVRNATAEDARRARRGGRGGAAAAGASLGGKENELFGVPIVYYRFPSYIKTGSTKPGSESIRRTSFASAHHMR